MRRLASTLAVVLALAAPLLARDGGPLQRILDDAKNAREPAGAFLRGLAAAGDLELTGDELRSALGSSGTMPGPLLAILKSVDHVSKRGERLTFTSSRKSSAELVTDGVSQGFVHLEKKVAFSIRRAGSDVVIDSFDGVELSKERDSMHATPRKIRHTYVNGKPMIKFTAGWSIFTKTVEIPLEERPAGSPTTGINGNVPR